MRVKLELELEIHTSYDDIEGCTLMNFREHVQFILKDMYEGDISGDLDLTSSIKTLEFLVD